MAPSAPVRIKIPTKIPQPPPVRAARPARPKARRAARSRVLVGGAGRPATRGHGNPVIELKYAITVYPGREGRHRWRAVWYENSTRRQCEATTEERLAARLEKVTERLAADVPDMERTGADLIAHYLDPDRLPADRRWSRKHAHTQRSLCERFAAPVIGGVPCQDIQTWHTQQVVNAAPTAQEGARVHRMISALVGAGIEGGYLANPRLAKVHWQAAGRPLPPPRVSAAGESGWWVDPAETPSAGDVERLGKALAARRHEERDQLMAHVAAYSGLRWGEIAALTMSQLHTAARVITVDRKVIEVAGHLYVEAPKNRKRRQAIYPRTTPAGYPLAGRLAARIEQARTEHDSGSNPLGLIFPSPQGKHWRSSNFNRTVLKRAYLQVGWTMPMAAAAGPGTACGTSLAPRPCSPGSSRSPTSPGWQATPATASRSTCTSGPPLASLTAPGRPPNNHARLRAGTAWVAPSACRRARWSASARAWFHF